MQSLHQSQTIRGTARFTENTLSFAPFGTALSHLVQCFLITCAQLHLAGAFHALMLWSSNCLYLDVKYVHVVILALGATMACLQSASQSSPADVPPALAAPSAASTDLTLEEAIAMARLQSPQLKSATAKTLRARATVLSARAYSNPNIEIYEGRQYARPIATPGTPGLLQHYAALQPIEIPSERRARIQAAKLGVDASLFGQQDVLLALVLDTKQSFYNALRHEREIHIAEQNLQLVASLYRSIQLEVQVGEKGQLELTRATAELARARFEVTSKHLQYAQAIAQLRATIAAPADASLHPKGTMELHTPLPTLTEMRTAVLETHPSLKQTQKEKEAAETSLTRERAARIPRPTAFLEYENQPDLRYWRTGVTIALPFFDRKRGEIEDAKAQISLTDASLTQKRLELTAALERAYEQYQLADQQASTLESGPLHAAESAVQGAQAAYKFGERGIVEVLDAQRVLQSVREDLLEAQFARQSALVDLEQLGALPQTGVRLHAN